MKTAIVTGSTGGLGQAIVSKFLKEGYQVIGTVTHMDKVLSGSSTNNFEKVVVDVSNEEEANSFIEKTISQYGSIDTAVLTVGGFAQGLIAETGTKAIMDQYTINFQTAYNVARPVFIKMLTQNSGRIFLVGSRPGLDAKSSKGMVAYGLAKSLLFRLAELMNDEGHKHNVVTSVVVPSTIDTPVNRKFMPDANFESWVKPEAIADVIFYYSSDEAAALREPVIKVYNNS